MIFNNFSKECLNRNYQYFGYVYGVVPIYVGGKNSIATRNYIPHIILDIALIIFRRLVKLGIVSPGYYIRKTKPLPFFA